MFKADPYYAKTPLQGSLVVVLEGDYPARGLKLISQPSRAICRHQIHELIFTDQPAGPGDIVDPISYLGFMEFIQGGVMVAGDRVLVNGLEVGTIAGFDETHMPNHLNIVIQGERKSGAARGLKLGDKLEFVKNQPTT